MSAASGWLFGELIGAEPGAFQRTYIQRLLRRPQPSCGPRDCCDATSVPMMVLE